MSQPLPERADVRQLRIQAKELLSSLLSATPEAIALATEHDPSLVPANAKLADAQRLLARKHGYPSWPKLVEEVEVPRLLEDLRKAVDAGEADSLEKLLRDHPALRKRIDAPIFGFDSPAIVRASHHRKAAEILPVLVKYGADPNIRTTWWAGGFSALDSANEETAELLLSLGAKHDVWSAAAHGKLDVLRDLLDRDPGSVNAPGGDGERPIHFAKTLEVAELLIERGADLEIRDIDHEGTPLQYQVNNPDVARALLRHGAKGDIFTAAALDDVDLLKRLLAEDPDALGAHVGQAPFVTTASEGGHIYLYRLGGGKSPHQVAAERKSLNVLRELEKIGSPGQNLVAAAWMEDAEALFRIMRANPGLTIGPEDSKALASAAQDGRAETVRMLLEAGADPLVTGMDRGTPLHIACWFGHLPVVKLLLDRVPIDLRDASHGSTPLGWATHGSQFCRNDKGDYVGVVRALLAAGADIEASANSANTSLLVQAGDREDVKEVLRSAGAKA